MAKTQEGAHSFYKVVPPSYVKAAGGVLPDKYILQGPNGDVRVVVVKKNGLQWFFREGWGPFIKDHSLKFGDSLFFTNLDHISTSTSSSTQKLHFQVYGINGYLKNTDGSTSTRSFLRSFSGDHSIRVPSSYVNASGGAMAVNYMLRGPNGEGRIVEVEKDVGGCWFLRGGWGPFVEKWPLREREILVFTFHSDVELHFQVFDRNGYLKKSHSFEEEGIKIIETWSSSSDSLKVPFNENNGKEVELKPVVVQSGEGPSDALARIHGRRARSARKRRKFHGLLRRRRRHYCSCQGTITL
ncbi:hypothetical protein Sjap_010148 [Stephania japonica]|uniref:TF-B3 domain-containing protein n=1 Tax=Stephania japonica TaxID=461633 RepID=A0AAP0JAW6_9MAGN